jgi:hypothetical protein
MATVKHLDELAEFHLRDVSRLTRGAEVLFGHVPTLAGDPALSEVREEFVFSELGESTGVEVSSLNDLFKFNHPVNWGEQRGTVIFYLDEKREQKKRFAVDAGVESSPNGLYHESNFVVLVDDVKAAGFKLSVDTSSAYKRRLEEYHEAMDAAAELRSEIVEALYINEH